MTLLSNSRGVLLRRIALGIVAASLVVVAVVIVVLASIRVSDDEGAGRRATRHLPTRARALAFPGAGVLVPPFTISHVEAQVGGWVLLDGRSREIVVVDSAGAEVRRFGRPGEGPGELRRPTVAAASTDGSVLALDAFTRHVDVFPPEGDPWRMRLVEEGCMAGRAVGLWSRNGTEWVVVRSCMDGLRRNLEAVVFPLGGLQHSVDLGPLPPPTQDLFAEPVAFVGGGRLFVGTTRRPCLVQVDLAPEAAAPLTQDHLCLPTPPPFQTPDSMVEAVVGPSLNRAAAAGVDLVLPDEMPTLVEVRETSRGPAVRILLDDLSEVWAFEEDGELVWAEVPDGVRVWPGWDRWLLTRDDLDGLRLWTVPYVEWRDVD